MTIVTSILGWGLLFWHELAHFIATKAVGGEAGFRFSNRLTYLVAVTDHFHIEVLPKSSRYLVYLAGMFADTILVATVFWIKIVGNYLGIEFGIEPILPVVFLLCISGIIWEFNTFLETDMYNFVSDYFDQENLYADTINYLRIKYSHNIGFRPVKQMLAKFIFTPNQLKEANDSRIYTQTDKQVFKWYGLTFIVGMVFTLAMNVFYTLPVNVKYLVKLLTRIAQTFVSMDPVEIAKDVIMLVLTALPYYLFIKSIRRKLKQHGSVV